MYLCTRASIWPVAGVAAAYAVVVGVALANPTNTPAHVVDLSTQGISLAFSVALLLLVGTLNRAAGCAMRTRVSWVLTCLLGVNLLARSATLGLPHQERFGRWDSFAATAALVAFCTEAYFALVPKTAVWRLGYLLLLVVGIPLLTALPNVVRAVAGSSSVVERSTLLEAADATAGAYSARNTTAFDKGTDTRVSVTVTAVHAYIAFSGTDSLRDVKTDLTITSAGVPAAWNGGTRTLATVHRGFRNAYSAVRDAVAARAAAEASAGRTVVFCGHSLGGALAVLAAYDFAASVASSGSGGGVGSTKTTTCVTFGAPQVGDALFVSEFDARVGRSVRVVNPYDWVPRSMSMQLEHVKGYYFATSPGLVVNFVDMHSMSTYRKAVHRSRAASWALLFAPVGYWAGLTVVLLCVRAAWLRLS